MKKFLLTIVVLVAFASNSFATHVMGADITYTWISGNDYQVTLTLYRDCSGSTIGTTPQDIDLTSSCGNFSASLDWVSTTDVSQVCATATTTCNGGTLPGTEQYVFTGVVTMPPCANWVLSWNLCCRNDGITNLSTPGSQDLYIETTMNNVIGLSNNSPQFSAIPTPYLCPNLMAIYSHAAADIDGDSLYYQFTTPLDGPGAPIAYTGSYNTTNPILTTGGMNLNPETGEMCFIPSVAQICVVAVLIKEYRNNILIGTYIREMQVVIPASCLPNSIPSTGGTAPTCGSTGNVVITHMGSTVTQTSGNSITMCPFDTLCFEMNFSDADTNNINLSTNITTAIPGATFDTIGNNTPNPVFQFCWTPTPLDSGLNIFTVTAKDDACPIFAQQVFTVRIEVFDQPYAGPDQIICGPQWAQLQASGGQGYTWSVLSGTPLNPGVNISCNPCANPQVKPTVTTTYLLTSSLAAACVNTDTVTVTVVPDYFVIPFGDTTLCDYLSTPIGVNMVPAMGSYLVNWSNASTLSSGTSSTPTASPTTSTTYVATVTSPFGCVKKDSVTVNVTPPPTLTINPGDTTVCLGSSLNFGLESTCMYTLEMFDDFGDGWNGQTISVYDNGVFVGTYTVLSTDNNGDWNTVTFPITNGNNITLVYGTGSFQSESAFNLIDGQGNTQFSVAAGGMSGWVDGNTYYTGVGNCGSTLSAYTFNWTPTTGLSNPNIQNPVATPTSTTTYTVTLTDAGGCTVNRDQTITVVPNYTVSTTQSDTAVCLGETVNFTATTNPVGAFNYSWSPAGIMNNPTSATPTATFTTPGINTIILTVDNGGGCTKTDTMVVNVAPTYAPNINIVNNDTTIGCLDSVIVNLDLGAIPTCDYTLEMFDDFGDGWNNQEISIYDNGVLVGTYTVLSTDNNGEWNTVTFPITNGGTITIVYGTGSWQSESSFNLIDGTGAIQYSVGIGGMSGWVDGNTYFTGTANCGPTLSNFNYSWTPTAGVSNPSVQNPILKPNSTTTYFVTVTDPIGGCTDTDSIIVSVNSQLAATFATIPAVCNTSNDGQIIANGNSPNPPYTFNFYDSTGVTLIQSNTGILSDTLFNVSSGSYFVSIVDASGCGFDTTISLSPTSIVSLTNTTTDTTICINQSINLSGVGSGGTGTVNLIWDNGLIGNGPHNVTPLVNTNYLVYAEDAQGCTSQTDTINVIVNPDATITLTSALATDSQTVCINTLITPIEYTIGGGGTGTTVTGLPNGVTGNYLGGIMTISGTPTDTGTYNYLVSTIGSCSQVVDSGSIIITSDATITLTSVVNSDNQIVCINSAITPLTYTIGGGGTGATVTGLPTGVTGTYNAGVFTISGTPTTIGISNYTVNTTGTCAQTSINGSIRLNDVLVVSAPTANRNTICRDDTTVLSLNTPATGGSGNGYTYNWYNSNNVLVGSGLNVTVTPSISPETYTLTVGDDCSTPTISQTIVIDWLPTPVPSFVALNVDSCYPFTAYFMNTSTMSPDIISATWNFGDGSTPINELVSTEHMYTSVGCYDVTLRLTTNLGCYKDTVMPSLVCARDYPSAYFSANPQPTDFTDPIIQLNNNSTGNFINTWTINGGIPSTSSLENPVVEFPSDSAGEYLVWLTVENTYGCKDSISEIVKIDGLYLFYMPTGFTPNGDNLNDTFKPIGDGIDSKKYLFMVFNRWGEKLFETDDLNEGWDGTYNGTPVQTDAYIWKIKTKELYRNVNTEHSGFINLTR